MLLISLLAAGAAWTIYENVLTPAALAEGTVHSLHSYQEPRFGIK